MASRADHGKLENKTRRGGPAGSSAINIRGTRYQARDQRNDIRRELTIHSVRNRRLRLLIKHQLYLPHVIVRYRGRVSVVSINGDAAPSSKGSVGPLTI